MNRGEQVQVGVAGMGWFGRTHLDAWASVHGATVLGVCDRDPAALRPHVEHAQTDFHTDSGGDQAPDIRPDVSRYSTIAELLASGIDLLDVVVTEPEHETCVRAALVAGVDVVVEKPLALTLDAAVDLVDLAERLGRRIYVSQVLRFDPRHVALADSVRGQRLRHLSMSRHFQTTAHDVYGRVHPVLNAAVHDIDLAVWLAGGTPDRVTAFASHHLGREHPDVVDLVLEWDGGLRAVIQNSWHLASSCPYGFTFDCVVHASDGTYQIRNEPVLHAWTANAVTAPEMFLWPRLAGVRAGALVAELQHFSECATRGEPSARVPLVDALAVMGTCQAALAAIESGTSQPVRRECAMAKAAPVVTRCEALRVEAVELLGSEGVRTDHASKMLHSYDASLEAGRPDLVVTPRSSDDLRALVAATYRHGVPFVMRGAGTGYSGGALPAHGGMVVLTAGLDRILNVDFDEGWIRCEPGNVLATIQQHAAAGGWRYLPDPSSYQVCTIGGNLAENAGGPHALGAGPTSHHVIAVEMVRPDGELEILHEQHPWDGGLDLRALMIGSEGTLGAISSATLRLVRTPEQERVVVASFTHQEDALATVGASFDMGLLPSAMDMLAGAFIPDKPAFTDPSLLFVGLQGDREEVLEQTERLASDIRRCGGDFELLDVGAFLQRRAELVREKVRRMVAASGCPRYYLFDAVAPRSRLAELMAVIRRTAIEFGLPVLNTFHAGDGNVHPAPFYDPDDADHRARLSGFSTQVLRECRRMGGSLSGEHGIGIEKRGLMTEFHSSEVLGIMRAVKRAADADHLSNPGKIIPEVAAPQVVKNDLVRLPLPGRPRVNVVDALVEIDGVVTFADVEAQLARTAYELSYEPLGGTPDQSVLAAIDLGLPGLREPSPARRAI